MTKTLGQTIPPIKLLALALAVTLITLISVFNSGKVLAQTTYTVGVVPQFDTRTLHKIWRPILDQLEKDTGLKFVLRGAPTIPAFEQEFSDGKFDFAYMNPYHVGVANREQGYEPLIRDIGRTLYGVLVVKADSEIKDIKQLHEKRVAFPAPNALGASLLMRAELERKHNVKVKARYVKTHSSSYLNVVLGKAEAAGGVQKTLNQQPEAIRKQLRVLYKTSETAPHPFAVHPRVPAEVRAKVQNALLQFSQSSEGKDLFANIPMKKVGVASMKDYAPLMKMGLDEFYVNPN